MAAKVYLPGKTSKISKYKDGLNISAQHVMHALSIVKSILEVIPCHDRTFVHVSVCACFSQEFDIIFRNFAHSPPHLYSEQLSSVERQFLQSARDLYLLTVGTSVCNTDTSCCCPQ